MVGSMIIKTLLINETRSMINESQAFFVYLEKPSKIIHIFCLTFQTYWIKVTQISLAICSLHFYEFASFSIAIWIVDEINQIINLSY
jgi:hypothetical protein